MTEWHPILPRNHRFWHCPKGTTVCRGTIALATKRKKEAKKIEDRSQRLFAPSLYATAAFYFFIPTPISRKRSTASLGLKSSLPALATWRAGRNVSAT